MGYAILPTGKQIYVEQLRGMVNFDQLLEDVASDDYTNSFRLSIIEVFGILGPTAKPALQTLKTIIGGEDKLLAEAATQAIKKIDVADKGLFKTTGISTGCNPCIYNKPSPQKTEVKKVTVEEITTLKLSDNLPAWCQCSFCEKFSKVSSHKRKWSDMLTRGNYFCNFCIRNDYTSRFNSNIFILTFRGILGYYYYSYYVAPRQNTMRFDEIQEYIQLHIEVGIENPAFRYDPETWCWFIDFNKVGKSKRRIPVQEVLKTIINILASFNLYENVKGCSPRKLYQKYENAVMNFYHERERANGSKIFAPTLMHCDIPNHSVEGKVIPIDLLQGFVPSHFVDNASRNKRTY